MVVTMAPPCGRIQAMTLDSSCYFLPNLHQEANSEAQYPGDLCLVFHEMCQSHTSLVCSLPHHPKHFHSGAALKSLIPAHYFPSH